MYEYHNYAGLFTDLKDWNLKRRKTLLPSGTGSSYATKSYQRAGHVCALSWQDPCLGPFPFPPQIDQAPRGGEGGPLPGGLELHGYRTWRIII